ncbi:MAG: NAD(P)H-dependent oxidoreductase [Gammaproteobacteria bacterium]|nr:NAD(P)H-dependent oxidoreductase [Gammaproteobacteria bacterium]
MKRLLIIYHSQGGSTEQLAEAVEQGAVESGEPVEVRRLGAFDAGLDDLLWADAVIFGTPENFGYMAGAIKDFLDRTYYPAQGRVEGLAYALFVKADNDGSGAVYHFERIASGYPLKRVCEPLIFKGDLTEFAIAECRELGGTLAAGLVMGVF